MENANSKKVWTDEERLELAAKLDEELDDYINQLEKKTYTEGWSADCWQEEMEKHPFFMKKAPEPGEELSPLMEGLQQLKFGEDYNTPEELAINYKEDGNFNFKHKKYRMAIISYTEGIKTKCGNQELIAQLYNNRATSHFMLQNYRSSLNDCKQALRLKSDYEKCLERAASCCFHIKDYDQCIEFCKQTLTFSPKNKHVSNLVKQAIIAKKHQQRDEKKQEKEEKKLHMERQKILSTIKSRGINLVNSSFEKVSEWEDLKFPSEQMQQKIPSAVQLGEDGRLLWTVIFGYPEVEISDYIVEFHEDVTIATMLDRMLPVPAEWNTKYQYTVDNVAVYFETKNPSAFHKVDINQTLGEIISDKRFVVWCGTPVFWVLPENVNIEQFKHRIFIYDTN